MRPLLAALVLLAAACSPADAPARCTPGVQIACACPGGSQGAQACAASGEGYGACVCGGGDAGADAVAVDAARTDVVDAGALLVDAPTDTGPTDASPTIDNPRCFPSTLATCTTPGFGEACWDLQTSNNQPLARHCGACNRACMPLAPRCVAGRCTE